MKGLATILVPLILLATMMCASSGCLSSGAISEGVRVVNATPYNATVIFGRNEIPLRPNGNWLMIPTHNYGNLYEQLPVVVNLYRADGQFVGTVERTFSLPPFSRGNEVWVIRTTWGY